VPVASSSPSIISDRHDVVNYEHAYEYKCCNSRLPHHNHVVRNRIPTSRSNRRSVLHTSESSTDRAVEHNPMGASSVAGGHAEPAKDADQRARESSRAGVGVMADILPEHFSGGESTDNTSGSAGNDVTAVRNFSPASYRTDTNAHQAASQAADSVNKVQDKHQAERGD
jgi:hypothetical protein